MGGVGGTGTGVDPPEGIGEAPPPSDDALEGPGLAGLARPEVGEGSADVASLAVSVVSARVGAAVVALLPFGSDAAASGGSSVVRAKKTPTITAAKPSIATMPIATPMTTPLVPLDAVLAAATGTRCPPGESCPGGNVP